MCLESTVFEKLVNKIVQSNIDFYIKGHFFNYFSTKLLSIVQTFVTRHLQLPPADLVPYNFNGPFQQCFQLI